VTSSPYNENQAIIASNDKIQLISLDYNSNQTQTKLETKFDDIHSVCWENS